MTGKLINIVVECGSKFSVSSPTVAKPIVHAMYMDTRSTLCGKRPISYTVTDHAGQSTTCEKCIAVIGVPAEPLGPKLDRAKRRPRRERPARSKEEIRADRRQWGREQFHLDDPNVAAQHAATKGMSRCWYITPKGRAALEKWAAEEKKNGQS
ncbi:MAG TPA: hypothetical protein VGR76_05790 [Candidatus Angelobacter sp.]|nr:hypothetical protein [Candidatus Angelobacter sp.]